MKASDIPDHHVIDLAAAWQADPDQPGVIRALMNEGIPEHLARYKVERLVKKGHLNYGVSINYAWPT